jgi:hypothetical protein
MSIESRTPGENLEDNYTGSRPDQNIKDISDKSRHRGEEIGREHERLQKIMKERPLTDEEWRGFEKMVGVKEHFRPSEQGGSPELKRDAERATLAGILAVESRAAADPVASSEWGKKAGKFFKSAGGLAVAGARVGLVYVPFKIALSLLKFAGKAILKRGKVGFAEGYKLGREAFSYDPKNDKK